MKKLFTEDQVRELLEQALDEREKFSIENMSNKAIVQHILNKEYVDGRWRSSLDGVFEAYADKVVQLAERGAALAIPEILALRDWYIKRQKEQNKKTTE